MTRDRPAEPDPTDAHHAVTLSQADPDPHSVRTPEDVVDPGTANDDPTDPGMTAGIGREARPHDRQPVSSIIEVFLDGWRSDTVSVGDIIEALGNRGYAVLMLILALPNLFPIYIPGLSPVTGLPLIYICWQLVIGRPVPRLPKWLSQRKISSQRFAGVMRRVLPSLRGVERVLKPRLIDLVSQRGERIIGIGCLLMLTILINPLPATNWLPALAISCAALAILERDGLLVIAGILVGIGAIAFFIAYIDLLIFGAMHLFQRLFGVEA